MNLGSLEGEIQLRWIVCGILAPFLASPVMWLRSIKVKWTFHLPGIPFPAPNDDFSWEKPAKNRNKFHKFTLLLAHLLTHHQLVAKRFYWNVNASMKIDLYHVCETSVNTSFSSTHVNDVVKGSSKLLLKKCSRRNDPKIPSINTNRRSHRSTRWERRKDGRRIISCLVP